MNTLIDTGVVFDVLRKSEPAEAFLRSIGERAFISPATITQLYASVGSQGEDESVAALLQSFAIARMDLGGYRRAGEFLRLYQASHGMDFVDAVMAATAEQHGLNFATLNVTRFPMFPKLGPPY